ncbi:MAG: SLC13 family permease [bacterium]
MPIFLLAIWELIYIGLILTVKKKWFNLPLQYKLNKHKLLLLFAPALFYLLIPLMQYYRFSELYLASFVFLNVYLYFIIFEDYRALASWCGVIAIFIIGILNLDKAFGVEIIEQEVLWKGVNWNVIGIFTGTMIVADLFMKSKVPELLAEIFIARASTVGLAIIIVSAFSGLISAVCENVATVLIVAPIAFKIAKRLKVSPAPFLIAIAIASNLEGAATLIGDPPSIILAANTNMTFNEFFWFLGRPSLFFAVQLGAVGGIYVLYLLFKKYKQPVEKIEKTEIISWIPTYLLGLLTLGLALLSIFNLGFEITGGPLCMVIAVGGLIWWKFKISIKGTIRKIIREFDFETVFLLMGIFILVAGLSHSGVIVNVAKFLSQQAGNNFLLTFIFLTLMSMIFSAFIDNVPYVTAMIPISLTMALEMGLSLPQTYALAYAIAIGASIGGNITPIGASANIVAVGLLKKEGYRTSFIEFVKIGLPFTLVATLIASVFIILFWH